VLDLIREGWDRLVRFFFREEVTTREVLVESSPSRILAGPLSTTSESEPELQEEPVALSHWKVTNYTESPLRSAAGFTSRVTTW